MRKLAPKRQRFVLEYLKDFNGAQAAIRAGYSSKAAKAIASKLLTFADVRGAIDEATAKINEKTEVTVEYVVRKIKANLERAEEQAEGAVVNKAAELLGRHLKMFTDKVEHSGDSALLEALKQLKGA